MRLTLLSSIGLTFGKVPRVLKKNRQLLDAVFYTDVHYTKLTKCLNLLYIHLSFWLLDLTIKIFHDDTGLYFHIGISFLLHIFEVMLLGHTNL